MLRCGSAYTLQELGEGKEFEQSRHETDPLLIAKMLAVGRQCLLDTQYKFDMAEMKIMQNIENTRDRR